MIRLLSQLLGSIVLCISCAVDNPITTIKVDLSSLDGEELSVFNIPEDVHVVLTDQKDAVEIDIQDEVILDLNKGWEHSYIHVKQGDKLNIDTLSSAPLVFSVKGELSIENKYLQSYQEILDQIKEEYMVSEVTKLPVDSFIMAVDSKNAPLIELMNKIENDAEVSSYFKKAMQARMVGVNINDLSYYKGFYNRHYDKDPTLPDNYYAAFENGNISDPMHLVFDESRQAISFYHGKDLDYREFDSLTDFYKSSISSANDVYGQSLVSNFAAYEKLSNMINFSGGLDGAEDLISNFNNSVSNKYLLSKLNKTITPWKPLVSGKVAPDFTASTRDGSTVKLSELKGKKVYVDVWATWCGPCIAEIPALKELEKDLHGEVEFVSVSIDEEKDKEKWEAFIDDRSLTGQQWMADGAWKSDVATGYNIKGIPRFLYIDEEGKIVSANAPRPSSATIKETLLN